MNNKLNIYLTVSAVIIDPLKDRSHRLNYPTC